MGIPKQFDHPDFIEAIHKTITVASDRIGILGFTESDIQRYYEMGFNLVAVGWMEVCSQGIKITCCSLTSSSVVINRMSDFPTQLVSR